MLKEIRQEREFKAVCDGILRHEFGVFLLTYAGEGKDGGVDAEYFGERDGLSGRWIFQYKFVAPWTDQSRARSTLIKRYRGSRTRKSEFEKVSDKGCVAYVLLTNVPMTPRYVDELRRLAAAVLPAARLAVWDASALAVLLRGREHLGTNLDSAKYEVAQRDVVEPVWAWLDWAQRHAHEVHRYPLWPGELRYERFLRSGGGLAGPVQDFSHWVVDTDTNAESVGDSIENPMFDYARRCLWPRAFERWDVMVAAMERAGTVVDEVVRAEAKEMLKDQRLLGWVPAPIGRELAVPLAYSCLEAAWGVPENRVYVNSQTHSPPALMVRGRYVWADDAVVELGRRLDQHVEGARARGMPAELRRARTLATKEVDGLLEAMWWPRNVGGDTPSGEDEGTD
ncbi:MAG: hypothetical protein H6742_18310 [Alphaproteobacteria bacterium]|nr:hypothetical protein [Alphaproteobacteria bacterium]